MSELDDLRAENERLKHYEADFKKMTIMHCGPKCSCVRDQREALATSEAQNERLQADLKHAEKEIERLRAAIEQTWRPEVAALRARIEMLERPDGGVTR